ncbi:MAG TPA: hypothetical protein VFY79_05170 [Dehalococcoidia bacterium]|nr:hypothetical protein [Dehalococcoidia bacterium]
MQEKAPAAQSRARRLPEDVLLAVASVGLGIICAVGYAIWEATRASAGTSAWGEFGSTMLFPGTLILAAVAAMVWLGWKANIDD